MTQVPGERGDRAMLDDRMVTVTAKSAWVWACTVVVTFEAALVPLLLAALGSAVVEVPARHDRIGCEKAR